MSGVLEVEDGGVSIDWVRVFLCDDDDVDDDDEVDDGLVLAVAAAAAAPIVVAVVVVVVVPFAALFVMESESRIVPKLAGSEGLIDGAAARFLPLRVFVSVEWDLGWLVSTILFVFLVLVFFGLVFGFK